MGHRGREFWDEIWDIIGPQIEGVMERGESTWNENQLVPIIRNGYLEEVSLDEPLMKISLALGVRLNHKKQRPNDYFFDLDQQNSPIRKQKAIKKQNIFKAKKRCQIEENPDDYCKLHPYDLEDMTKFLTKINNGIDTKEKLISQIIKQNQKLLNEERELQIKLKELEKKRIRKDCHTQTEKSRNK